jgi:hypothetical protein
MTVNQVQCNTAALAEKSASFVTTQLEIAAFAKSTAKTQDQ